MTEIKRTPSASNPKPRRRGQPAAIKYYLVAYNVLSALGWGYVLLTTLQHLSTSDTPIQRLASYLPASLQNAIPYIAPSHPWEKYAPPALKPLVHRASTAYQAVGGATAVVQSFAVLEVLHSLLGWVRSPLGTTFSQVYSRLYVVWGILHLFPHTRSHPLYASAVLSWSVTEVIRYTFYACNLLGSEPYSLLWLRYTLFYVLYPTGASSEAGLIFASLPAQFTNPSLWSKLAGGWRSLSWTEFLHADFRAIMFLIWWPSLYMLYTYMFRQRKRVLGSGRTLGSKPKSL